jgi:hypothetical protein
MGRETILEGPFAFWTSANLAARREAMLSPLPGCFDGPADAYRHIIGTAELHRRFGFATAYGIATGNEIYGTHWAEAPHERRRMDDHNSAIGLEIGATARTCEEVVRRARAAGSYRPSSWSRTSPAAGRHCGRCLSRRRHRDEVGCPLRPRRQPRRPRQAEPEAIPRARGASSRPRA